jgi:hypothetical protein
VEEGILAGGGEATVVVSAVMAGKGNSLDSTQTKPPHGVSFAGVFTLDSIAKRPIAHYPFSCLQQLLF